MIVVAGGIKGGSGKTTVATNLAVMAALQGRDVLLVDADEQETAADFTALRNEVREGGAGYTSILLTHAGVRTETLRLAEKYETIIIDTGGRDTSSQRAAVSIADLLLIPFVPRSFDVWTIEKVGLLVSEMLPANPNLKAWLFLNRADARGSDNDDAMRILRKSTALAFIDTPLGNRKAFANAGAKGLSVVELKPEDVKARAEMVTLYQCVFNVEWTLLESCEANLSTTGELYKVKG